jgi:gag-polyprotein putative aspartyl protease
MAPAGKFLARDRRTFGRNNANSVTEEGGMAASLKPIISTAMKTLFLATAAFAALMIGAPIGKAHAAFRQAPRMGPVVDTVSDITGAEMPGVNGKPWTPEPAAPAPRYFIDTWAEVWTVGFDTVTGELQFRQKGQLDGRRWGRYTNVPSATASALTATVGPPGAILTLSMVNSGNSDPFAKLTWISGAKSGTMTCHSVDASDAKPAEWHDAPPPVVAGENAPTGSVSATPATAAPAHATPAITMPIFMDKARAFAPISVGSVWVSMQVDTGADTMSVTETVAAKLLANHEATEATPTKMSYADGSEKTVRTIRIDTVAVSGRQVHGIYAAVVPNSAPMLLSLDVLNQIGSKFSIDTVRSEMVFE